MLPGGGALEWWAQRVLKMVTGSAVDPEIVKETVYKQLDSFLRQTDPWDERLQSVE